MSELTVYFRGGPLGGETREIDTKQISGSRLRIPALSYLGPAIMESGTIPIMPSTYRVEEYIISGSRGRGYEMTWIHPEAKLIEENEKLKYQLRKLGQLEAALEAVETLREFVNAL